MVSLVRVKLSVIAGGSGDSIGLYDSGYTPSLAYLKLEDTSPVAGFVPALRARAPLSNQSFTIEHDAGPVTDKGTTPVIDLRAKIDGAAVVTRPVLTVSNHNSALTTLLANGNVGIGTTSPNAAAKLEVAGLIVGKTQANAANAVAVDWSGGNTQALTTTSTGSGARAIAFTNMVDGTSYTLAITNPAAATWTYTFSQAGLTFKYLPANGPTTASADTIYTFIRVGSIVYCTWLSGF